MRRRSILLLGSLLLTAGPLAAQTSGGSGQACPDTAATGVAGSVSYGGKTTHCGIGISLFGIKLGVLGPECPDMKFIYPARAECMGRMLEGHQCVEYGKLQVMTEKCKCVEATILGTGFLAPVCDCVSSGVGGYVEGFETQRCPTPVPVVGSQGGPGGVSAFGMGGERTR